MEHTIADINLFTYEDLLEKVKFENYNGLLAAIVYAFDVDVEIIYHIQNLDIIWRPKINNDKKINYFQWITMDYDRRDICESILSYLFTDSDMYYDDLFEFTDRELELRIAHIEKITEKYGNRSNYFNNVSTKLWRSTTYLVDNYSEYIK